MELSPSKYANIRVKFIGSDARLTLVFFIIWMIFKTWIVFFLFLAILLFSIILEYNNTDFLNFIKKIRMFLSGKNKKNIKNKY